MRCTDIINYEESELKISGGLGYENDPHTTESCSDIPASMLEKLNVPMVPFSVNFPDRTVLDGELPIREFYDFYESTRQIPKTCAVSPYQYSEFFNRLLEDPEVEIVHIGYSSACSCSFQNALISLQDCDESRIHLVDCLNVSGGFGLLTLKAMELHTRNPQWSAAELAEEVRKWVPRIGALVHSGKARFPFGGRRAASATLQRWVLPCCGLSRASTSSRAS